METEKLLTPNQAAEFLGIAEGTLANWRFRGCGPPYIKYNDRVCKYERSDLQAYIKENKVQPGGR